MSRSYPPEWDVQCPHIPGAVGPCGHQRSHVVFLPDNSSRRVAYHQGDKTDWGDYVIVGRQGSFSDFAPFILLFLLVAALVLRCGWKIPETDMNKSTLANDRVTQGLFALFVVVLVVIGFGLPATAFSAELTLYNEYSENVVLVLADYPVTHETFFTMPPGKSYTVNVPSQSYDGSRFLLPVGLGGGEVYPNMDLTGIATAYFQYGTASSGGGARIDKIPGTTGGGGGSSEIELSADGLESFLDGFWFSVATGFFAVLIWYARSLGRASHQPLI